MFFFFCFLIVNLLFYFTAFFRHFFFVVLIFLDAFLDALTNFIDEIFLDRLADKIIIIAFCLIGHPIEQFVAFGNAGFFSQNIFGRLIAD